MKQITGGLQGGNTFVALRGASFDAHKFVGELVDDDRYERIVVNDSYEEESAKFIRVKDTNLFLQQFANTKLKSGKV